MRLLARARSARPQLAHSLAVRVGVVFQECEYVIKFGESCPLTVELARNCLSVTRKPIECTQGIIKGLQRDAGESNEGYHED